MTRFTLVLVAALVATAAALAASAPTRPPGGPAPKALIGTWHTTLTSADVGNTIRFSVDAKNADGTTSASSVPTAVVTAATKPPPPPPTPATGCPTGTGSVQVTDVGSPARLLIDQQQTSPQVVNRGTQQLIVRYHVSACGGRSVQGALVYATAVPFNQLSIPAEQTTGSDGWASLTFHTMAGFPARPRACYAIECDLRIGSLTVVASLYIRDVPESLYNSLSTRARRHGRLPNAEILDILGDVADHERDASRITRRLAQLAAEIQLPPDAPTPEQLIREGRDS